MDGVVYALGWYLDGELTQTKPAIRRVQTTN